MTDPIAEKDQEVIWHPFTHLKYANAPVTIVGSKHASYFTAEGKELIDAISSWWVTIHGHSHPYIAQQVFEQLSVNAHSIFSGFTHQPAVELADRLISILPPLIRRVFYSDDGSTSVEVALKMAIQYWENCGQKRKTFIAFENAYHGDTFGSMSVGARNEFNQAFSNFLFDVVHIPVPDETNLKDIIHKLQHQIDLDQVAGFIYEPLVQGAGGMRMYPAHCLNELIRFFKEQEIICIADEVMTGFGRTGKWFASDWMINKPDIICLSKGITGGVMPLGVTACTSRIYQAFIQDSKLKTFFHGHSYTANPVACAAAIASLDLFEIEKTFTKIERIVARFREFSNELKQIPFLDVRTMGCILAIEFHTKTPAGYLNSLSESLSNYFFAQGILVRPLGNVLYFLPPYCITDTQLNKIFDVTRSYLAQYDSN